MAGEAGGPQWEGTVTAKLQNPTVDSVWSLLQDFCNLHKWFPQIRTCCRVAGDQGHPGLVRYCDGGGSGADVKWCHEKLLSMDPISRSLSYQVLENNMGIKSYTSTIRVMQIDDGGDGAGGCRIEWSFVADPIEGVRREDFVAYMEAGLQEAAQKMEEGRQPC